MFKPGQIYKRKDLHLKFGGQQQGGISTPSKHPFIFLFTGLSGSDYGYQDKWDDKGAYHYTGEGQIGPMRFTKGNLAYLKAQRMSLSLIAATAASSLNTESL